MILSKAAELDGSSESLPDLPHGMSLDDMKAIAAEVGMDPALIERAAQLFPSTSRDSLFKRLVGGPFARDAELALPVSFSRERAEHLLAVLRSSAGKHGEGDVTSAGMSWSSRDTGEILHVSAHGSDQGTRVRIVVDHRAKIVPHLILGGIGAFLALMVAISVGDSGESFAAWLPYVILAGGVAAAAGIVRSALRRIGRGTQATLDRLLNGARGAIDYESAS